MNRFQRSAQVASSLVLVLGCAVEEIVLVDERPIPSGADADVEMEDGRSCRSNDDCEFALGEYCSMPSCESTIGSCRRPPIPCNGEAEPVCGCDGVTYFNDCWRETSLVRASTPGDCTLLEARRCGSDDDLPCPENAFCGKLLRLPIAGLVPLASCLAELDLPGVCWVLPFCDGEPSVDRWVPCVGDAFGACVDLCTAIRSEIPHMRVVDSRASVCSP